MRKLRRRHGRALGELPSRRRPLHRARTYHGYTLEAWQGSAKDYGKSAVEVRVYKGGWHEPVAHRFGPTPAAAFAAAESWVDNHGR